VVTDLCRRRGMSSATYYARKAKSDGLEVSDAKRLRALEEKNPRLKRLLADTMLDNAVLKHLLSKNGDACCEAGSSCASADGARDERAAGACCRRGGSHEHAVSLVSGGMMTTRGRVCASCAAAQTVRLSTAVHPAARGTASRLTARRRSGSTARTV